MRARTITAILTASGLLTLVLPGSAGAAKIYFDTTASFSGVPVGPAGQAASASFHQLFVGRVNTALIGHQRPCQAFAQGAFATAGARPVVVTPGINGSFSGPHGGTHAFQGFGIYVAPVGEARERRYSIQATDPNGQFPQNSPGNQAMTNDPFQIDSDRYLQSVSFTVTLKKNGSGSVVERSPHHYAEDWTCRNTPPPEITLEDARGRPIQRTDSPVTDNPALVGRHVYVRGRNFEPGPVTITLNGRDVAQARAHADGDFTTTFVLEAFPARDCAARVGAHQGADNVTAELPGDRQADVAAAQGGVVLPGGRGTARVGDVLCDGEDYPAVVHDAVKRPGQGLIAVMTTSGGAGVGLFFISSRARGVAPIEYDGLIQASGGLVVQMPDGDVRLTAVAGVPVGGGGCVAPPASVFNDPVILRECWMAPGSLTFRNGLTLIGRGRAIAHGDIAITGGGLHCKPDSTGDTPCTLQAVGGSIGVRGGVTFTGDPGEPSGLVADGSVTLRG